MGKIRVLDDALSNKIAAGEVIERPASIVKELVENAIDAGSTVIEILIEAAGLKEIRIIDNGSGIEADDVEAAFLRHGTSKIKDENDLFRIRTLGFRGEALPSVASIAHVEMKTATGDGAGTQIILEGNQIIQHEAASGRKGTDIRVKNIFYNTPARLKYLKSESTELGNISDVVNRLAISHPEIAFLLKHHDKTILKTVGNGNIEQVFSSIYGLETARKMISFQESSLDFEISGLIGLPELNRANRNYITILINGRYIKNFLITKAILDAYHTFLPINRYPFVLLHIQVDPFLVDVNVHPTKMEVRLSKEQELMAFVTATIKEVLHQQTLIPSGYPSTKSKMQVEQSAFMFTNKNEKVQAKTYPSYQKAQQGEQPVIDYLNEQIKDSQTSSNSLRTVEADLLSHQQQQEAVCEEKTAYQIDQQQVTERVPTMYAIGQVHGTYILAQNELGFYMIDQHAAQERIKYEFYCDQVGKVTKEVQELLLPITLEFPSDIAIKVSDYREILEDVGVFLEEFGNNCFIIRKTPVWFPKDEEEKIIEELIEQAITTKKTDIKKIREAAAITMSCRGSIKANHALRLNEMQSLLDELRQAEEPFTCPHGRPIIIHFSTYELEKMFKRTM